MWDNFERTQQNEYEENRRNEKYDEAQEKVEPLLKKLMPDFDKYFNDEGEDVRELAEKAEAQRDAIREEEITAMYYWDEKYAL